MIASLLKSEFNTAVNNPENINSDNTINWNFVDADCYMEVGKLFKDDKEFYDIFDTLATEYELDVAADRLEVLKQDFLGL